MSISQPWLTVESRGAPLIVSLPHTGTDIPAEFMPALVSPWLSRRDADWWIDRLYGFARDLDATIVHTAISRTVIDVNRDPGGASLYPGQATTELCPTTTFDGEPLYRAGMEPDPAEITRRRGLFFEPYHLALRSEIARLRLLNPRVVVYDCHSIRSVIPRLFEGQLPNCNIGSNDGRSCDPALTAAVETACGASAFSHVTNGRFRGGYITRSLGEPENGVHALQMELACRTYMSEPQGAVEEGNWPTPFDAAFARPAETMLCGVLEACLHFARQG